MASAGHGTASGFVRRKTVSAHNDATMRTVADFGEFGTLTLDEPVPHGGTGRGPSPLQAVLGALCGGEAGTFPRAAAGLGPRFESPGFEAPFPIDIRGRRGGAAGGGVGGAAFGGGGGARGGGARGAAAGAGGGDKGDRGPLPGNEPAAGRQGRPADRVGPRQRRHPGDRPPVLSPPRRFASQPTATVAAKRLLHRGWAAQRGRSGGTRRASGEAAPAR